MSSTLSSSGNQHPVILNLFQDLYREHFMDPETSSGGQSPSSRGPTLFT